MKRPMGYPQKEHRFVVVVKTLDSRKQTELDLLVAFACRKPDYSEFHLLRKPPKSRKP